jgi:cyclase
MKLVYVAVVFAMVVGVLVLPTAAEEGSSVKVSRLTDRLYLLSTDQGSYTTNTIASVGADGVLLVDTQAEADAEALRDAVAEFGKGMPKIIINTHRHVEHVGGNAIFGPDPIVIAHELVPSKLRSGSYLFNEFPAATFPDITFPDSMTLWFNGEEIRLIAMGGSHDDNEIIVHFVDSKIVHLSSLVNGFNFPSIDSDGDALRFAELVARAIEILPDDVTIVSGHNGTGSVEDLRAYHRMLVATEATVREGLATGKDAETLKEEKAFDAWKIYAGSYVSVDGWIDSMVEAFEPKDHREKVFERMYYAIKADGADAAVGLYRELKSEHPDDYDFSEYDLLVIGDKLLKKGRNEPAIAFLEASRRDFPESDYAYFVNYDLAVAHKNLGNRGEALCYCRMAFELAPENENVALLLRELKSEQNANSTTS